MKSTLKFNINYLNLNLGSITTSTIIVINTKIINPKLLANNKKKGT